MHPLIVILLTVTVLAVTLLIVTLLTVTLLTIIILAVTVNDERKFGFKTFFISNYVMLCINCAFLCFTPKIFYGLHVIGNVIVTRACAQGLPSGDT